MAIFDQATKLWLVSLMASTAWIKVAFFFVAWVVLWLPVAMGIAIFLKWHPLKPIATEQKLPLLATLYFIAPLILWGDSWLEGVAFSSYGLDWQWTVLKSLGIGLGAAILSLLIIFISQWRFGWIKWHLENLPQLRQQVLPILVLGLWIGVTEELIFRGFLLNTLEKDYSILLAAAISSIIFAILHLVWEQKDTLPQLPGLWLMGMVLVLARKLDSGSLGLAWGLHAGWIWGLTCLDSAALLSYTDQSPIWITGLRQKPLAGVAGIVCLLMTAICLWWLLPIS